MQSFKASETLLGIETAIKKLCAVILPTKLQSLWNPFRDWNHKHILPLEANLRGFKASETLLGIETSLQRDRLARLSDGFKASETLLGIETGDLRQFPLKVSRFKASETLLGIETSAFGWKSLPLLRFKASETLLGIETSPRIAPSKSAARLQSLWNPFRDWNRSS